MEFLEILEHVGQLGIYTVLGAVFVYAALVGINFLKELGKRRLERVETPSHSETVKTRLRITPEVKSVLKELLLHTHASRAYVFEFHNGKTSIGGLPFIYMSNTYEVLGPTASSQTHARQQMPFTLFDSLISQVIRRDAVTIDLRNRSEDIDPIVYETLDKRGTTVMIGTKLQDEHKRVIGFLGVDFCDDQGAALVGTGESALAEIERIVFREAQALSTLLYVKITHD